MQMRKRIDRWEEGRKVEEEESERMIEIACNEYFSGPNFLIYFNSVIPSVLRKRGVNGVKFQYSKQCLLHAVKKKKRNEKWKKKKGKKERKKERNGQRWDFFIEIINES